MNLDLLEEYLEKNKNKVAAVFITTLLGFAPDTSRLIRIEDKYKVKIMLDNCEANLTQDNYGYNVSSRFTSTTSMYFGHHLQTAEMGFVFTNDEEEYKRFLLYRNHGMVRSLDRGNLDCLTLNEYKNNLVDYRFDFYLLGNNFRNSDIHGFIARLDFKRRFEYIDKRRELYYLFYKSLDKNRYLLPDFKPNDVPFSLPIICFGKDAEFRRLKILDWCETNKTETRPIVGTNMLRQRPYQKYADYRDFPVAETLTLQGCYVGLHTKLKKQQILDLVNELNKL